MKKTFVNLTILSATFLVAFAMSCKKPGVDPITTEGQTIVKLPSDEGYNLVPIDLSTNSQTFNLLEIRRDVANESQLNTTMKVVISEDTSVITAYNAAHTTTYIPLPTTAFTVDPANPRTGKDYTVTFAPGEFYKTIRVTVPNATVLDPANQYAVGFKIKSIDGQGKISESQKVALVEVALKNKYDGKFEVTGTLVDNAVATITGKYPFKANLETVSATEVILNHTETPFAGYFHPILNSGAASAYGSFVPVFVFDPVTNKVTSVYNGYGQPAPNGRSGALDPSGINTWDPATKTLRVSYFMLQPGTTVRTRFTEVFTYKGAR